MTFARRSVHAIWENSETIIGACSNPAGSLLVGWDTRNRVFGLDVTGTTIQSRFDFSHDDRINGATFVTPTSAVTYGIDGQAKVCDFASNSVLATLDHGSQLLGVAEGPMDRYLATFVQRGLGRFNVVLWEWRKGSICFEREIEHPWSRFYDDGRRLLIINTPQSALVVASPDGDDSQLELPSGVRRVFLLSGGRLLVICGSHVVIAEPRNGDWELEKTWPLDHLVSESALDRERRYVLCAGTGGEISFIDLAKPDVNLLRTIEDDQVRGIHFGPNTSMAVVRCANTTTVRLTIHGRAATDCSSMA